MQWPRARRLVVCNHLDAWFSQSKSLLRCNATWRAISAPFFVDADALKEIGPKLQLEKSRATMGGLCGVPIKNSANLVNDIGHL